MNAVVTAHAGRGQKKRVTRDTIEAAAWRLFLRQGYDDTTVHGIAEAAEVAPRTFFRHFESKEAVLFGDWRADLEEFLSRLRLRPDADPPLVALEQTMLSFSDRFESDRPMQRLRMQLARSSPKVGNYYRQVIKPAWQEAITGALAQRLGVDAVADVRPRLYAGVAAAVLDAARERWWAEGGGTDLLVILGDTFAELRSSTSNAP
jgi:AcrR family transcriptional regulator